MPGRWDSRMKLLINKVPQDFVSWLVEGAIYEEEVSPHLKTRNIDGDVLYRIRVNERPSLLHIEFQFRGDPDMARRLWEYNVLATCQNSLPVYSYVLYLKKEEKFIESPSLQQYPTGQDIHHFHFGVIKLWEIPTLHLKNLGLKGLLPLLPLTREGKDRAVIEDVITELSVHKSQSETDLLSLAYGLASLVFRSENDHNWLKRRFSMLDELLNESWAFQEILQKGIEKGLQEGRLEGLQEGLKQGQEKALKQGQEKTLEASRRTLITLVEHRYSSLTQQAREKANLTLDLDALQDLILQVSLSTTEAEVRESLK